MPSSGSSSPWHDYERRLGLFLFAFLGYLPGVALIGAFLTRMTGSETPQVVLALAWMAFFGTTGHRLNAFPCPRCGRAFFMRGFAKNPFVGSCMHCGCPKWSS